MKFKSLLAAIAVICCASYAGTTEFVPLQQRAQGQSLAGASLLNDALFSNPASSAFVNAYSIDGTFLNPKTFSVSILDTKTSALGGAMGYYRMMRPGFDQPIQVAKAGTSGRLSENIGFGIAGKAAWGPDLAGTSASYKDIDFGMLAKFDLIQFGVNINNILGGNAAMGEFREYALGTRINWEDTVFFSVAVTGETATFRPVQYGFGAEYVSPYFFALKGGFRTRPIDEKSFWAAGLSILSPKVSIHYAVEFENRSGGNMEHTVGTTFLF
jgi:hypothetical protein